MGKILIDLSHLGSENKTAIQGIKIFLNKNKDSEMIVLGELDNLLTIKDNKRVKIISPKENIEKVDARFNKIADSSLKLAMSLLTSPDEDIVGFVTYSKKNEVAKAADEFLHKVESSPLFVATFANYKTHRVTCIGDLGYKDNPTTKDYVHYLDLMSRYMKHAFKKDKIEFKLLTFNKDYPNPLIDIFKDKEGYKGQIEGRGILKCDTDIIIGHPKEFLGIISGIDHGISIYDEFMKDEVHKNVGIRYFVYPMFKSVITNFHMEIDQKLTSGGNILLGYKKNIVVVDPNTIKQGVKVSLDLANKLETL
ncbi:MAG: hypothetical protein MJ213_03250 [Bacilli bacterium]|nr:hypothetical protein [Bacilli bacterium]